MNLPVSNSSPNPEVPEKVTRRRYTGEYKKRILEQYESLPSGRGALLRREGLWSSHIDSWRKQREAGVLEALGPKKRGRKPKAEDPRAREIAELRRKLARAEQKLKQAELIIDIQKKVSEMLGIPLAKPELEPEPDESE